MPYIDSVQHGLEPEPMKKGIHIESFLVSIAIGGSNLVQSI